jgi:hypothetical protein
MKATRGRFAALNTHGRARRAALVCVLSTTAVAIGLVAAPAASAWGTRCATGPAAIRVIDYSFNMGLRHSTSLGGNVNSGDLIQATVRNTNPPSGNCAAVTVTFVGYEAPGRRWDPKTANQQAYSNSTSTDLASGAQGQVEVTAPAPCFQVDLVTGGVIFQLDPTINQTYSQQNRLIDWANGGLPPPACPA